MLKIEKIILKNKIVDKDNYFEIGYCEELKIYMMHVFVSWIASYYRYYKIDKEDYKHTFYDISQKIYNSIDIESFNKKIIDKDYNLYKNNPQSFYKKYENEIKQNNNAYTENFIGSSALRDYDGVKDFQHSYPTKNEIINPFQNYVYIEGILFARIIWEIGEFLIPPFQKIISKDGSYKFPLREISELKNNSSGNPICYYFPINNKSKNVEDLK